MQVGIMNLATFILLGRVRGHANVLFPGWNIDNLETFRKPLFRLVIGESWNHHAFTTALKQAREIQLPEL